MAHTLTSSQTITKLVLGPFVGDITHSSVKLWLNVRTDDGGKNVFVTLKLLEQGPRSEAEKKDKKRIIINQVESPVVVQSGVIRCLKADLGTGIVTLENLEPNSKYSYQLWQDEAHSIELDLNPNKKKSKSDSSGLKYEDLFFWTLPEDGYGRQLDFLLMSCHHPETKKDDGFDGFAVWHQIPEIVETAQNANVRFAILAGDQVYADEIEARVLKEDDPLERQKLYLSVYKKFWQNEHYRRVLCRIPAVMIWDDHDITDGWGSREDSFKSKDSQEFKPEWLELFKTAKEMFRLMQASRNPGPLSNGFAGGFDTCFSVGGAGFVVADLRSNRNIRQFKSIVNGKSVFEGQIWLPEQLQAIKDWIAANRKNLHTLFFLSSVVFSHGAPSVEKYLLKVWFRVIDSVNLAARLRLAKKKVQWFNDKVGDLRDDINDSWGSDANKNEAEHALDFLFELENPSNGDKALNVVILTGDIHTPGYSTIYSSRKAHQEKAVMPHIVATPVAYEPFSWVGEAIFRHLTKVVALGNSGTYTSQVSHHFCYRNVVVVSLRNYEADESHLKVKYYLEGFPEPQVMLFDLNHGAHRENIHWRAVKKPKLLRRLVSWITRTPIPPSFVEELPPASADIPLPEKLMR
jgi:phosphodiesterase/alkaline phosphatase D-like protein